MDSSIKKVMEYLTIFGNWAQTALALQERFGLDDGTILKALTLFPGIALRGEPAAHELGAFMALGLVYGRGRERLDDWAGYISSLPPARRFYRRFEKEVDNTMRGDILESEFGRRFNLGDPVEANEWQN